MILANDTVCSICLRSFNGFTGDVVTIENTETKEYAIVHKECLDKLHDEPTSLRN